MKTENKLIIAVIFIPRPRTHNAIMLEEYQVEWNFKRASRTLTPRCFGKISNVSLLPTKII